MAYFFLSKRPRERVAMDFFTKLTNDPLSSVEVINYVTGHPWMLLSTVTAGLITYKVLSRPRNLPPGPRGLPFIGAMLHFMGDDHADQIKLYKDYGDIASYYMGNQLGFALHIWHNVTT